MTTTETKTEKAWKEPSGQETQQFLLGNTSVCQETPQFARKHPSFCWETSQFARKHPKAMGPDAD